MSQDYRETPLDIEQVSDLAERLSALIVEETALLQHERPAALAALAEEKGRLSAQLMRAQTRLNRERPAVSAQAGARLQAALSSLQQALMVQGKLVLRLKSISEGLMAAIAQELNADKRPVPTYGAKGLMVRERHPLTTLSVNASV